MDNLRIFPDLESFTRNYWIFEKYSNWFCLDNEKDVFGNSIFLLRFGSD